MARIRETGVRAEAKAVVLGRALGSGLVRQLGPLRPGGQSAAGLAVSGRIIVAKRATVQDELRQHLLKEQASCYLDHTDNITARSGYYILSMQMH